MPKSPSTAVIGPDGLCSDCGQTHVTRHGKRSCLDHVRYDRASYMPGQDRKPLEQPRPCRRDPTRGAERCRMHGAAAPQVKAAAQRRVTEEKIRTMLGNAGETVTDPIAKLCTIAGRAVAFMEALAAKVDTLEDLTDEHDRAAVALYGRSIKDAAAVVESIIRMGIAERLAKADADLTASLVAFIDGVLTDLGLNPRDPQVAGTVARRLELVAT